MSTLKEIFVPCCRVHDFVRHVAKVLLVYVSNDTLAECLKGTAAEASQDSVYVFQDRKRNTSFELCYIQK